jgi:glycine dehydrogenase
MKFVNRHIGLKKVKNITNLISKIIPNNLKYNLNYFKDVNEVTTLKELRAHFSNSDHKYLIGMDYNPSILPNVIKRNLLENPKWYTSYTPYQAEISQGRLESLYNYQTLICELTKLPISNCSLLDTGTASVEALNLTYNYHKGKKKDFFIDENIYPHVKEIVKSRAKVMDINIIERNLEDININDELFGVLFSYSDTNGNIKYKQEILAELKKNNTSIISYNDLLSLLLLKPPGELGVDISLGTTQRFGLPLWYGGPHSAFFSVKKDFLRFLPGRIVGKSKDRNNNTCYRLALQTREQHIKKERATSNICTSQALLANTSAMYAIYHGKEGLHDIAKDIYLKTNTLRYFMNLIGIKTNNEFIFDSITFFHHDIDNVNKFLECNNLFCQIADQDHIKITLNETITIEDCVKILELLNMFNDNRIYGKITEIMFKQKMYENNYISDFRKDSFLDQDIFKEYKTETEMLRYINNLSDKDYSLVNGMIPLGSCTMKLNATSQLEPLSWNELQNYHPFDKKIPDGYKFIIDSLSDYLLNVTNMKAISFQPNAGSIGEYTGLLCIKKYHEVNQETRNICLIPESAHGTNFTSAKLANLKIVKFDDKKNLDNFKEIVEQVKNDLSCLIITYPNTFGLFNKNIKEMCDIIHNYGGLVYMDGANMNAQSGLLSPGSCGADVCHLNLHKTFCIPHGGGGPGMGPICVNEKLEPYLPSNNITNKNYYNKATIGMITNSNYSSASLLSIPYIYFKTMGSDGIKRASEVAIYNANYLKNALKEHYKIYITDENNNVGHEFIIDLNEFKKYGITDKDIAKRLIDYSFHPPTMSWPVPNSLMIEPTESEDINELNRFINAMINIRKEIDEIKTGLYSQDNNVIVNSPHSIQDTLEWNFPYSIEKGLYPVENLKIKKHFPSNSRIDDIYGDRNLILKD